MNNIEKVNNINKKVNFILILGLSLLPFIFLYITKFLLLLQDDDFQKIRVYDIFMLIFAFVLLIYRKNFNTMNNDILYGGKSLSKSSLLSGMYGVVTFSVGFVIVKEEIIYLTNYFPYLENFKFMETVNYFDFYDKLFWENVSFVNNLTFLSAFLKVWLIGFLLIFNPFSMKGHVFEINTKLINLTFLFIIVISLSLYDSINVETKNLMKANYYFFKQSLIFLIIFLVLCNINEVQKEKKYRKVIFSSEVLLFYVMLISLQTLFYHYIYKVYFLEVILIILAVASRDKFNIKSNKYFCMMLSGLLFYELIFLVFNAGLIEKDLLEKIIAMSISICLYFYKDNIIKIYRKKYPRKSEEDFKLENLKNEFIANFGDIFDASKIDTIKSDGTRYKINNEILFEVDYPKNLNNSFHFKFNIIYNKDAKYEDWFIGDLKRKFIFSKNMYKDGTQIKLYGEKIKNNIKIQGALNLSFFNPYD